MRENGGYRLADGIAFDDLEYDGRPIGRDYDAHKTFRDPFNPLTGGIFSENIRAKGKDDLAELCESIESLGYVKDPGIVKDEHVVVLSGHRRLEALEKLGIDPAPHVTIKRFGDGDAADVERLKFAIALNTAQKPFTPKDRKRIAEYLYGTGEWSMARIGELLKVTTETISVDLKGIERREGIDSRGWRHTPKGTFAEVKPKVVEDLRNGMAQCDVSRKYGLTRNLASIWAKELTCQPSRDLNSVSSSSSKIPEDQQQAFFNGVLDEGRPQPEVISELTGKPVKSIPTAWRAILNEERGRREERTKTAQQQAPQHQCTCPKCGHAFTPEEE